MRHCGLAVAVGLAAAVAPVLAQATAPVAPQPASEARDDTDHGHHGLKGTHRITLGLGHTHISQGSVDGETEWLATASWSLNYDYWLANRWAIGLQNDLILEQFVIEHGQDEQLERKYPFSTVPVVLFKPVPLLALIGGAGVEYASGEAIGLTRLGAEVGWHVGRHWEVGGAVVWDNKWGYYNSWGIAFTVSWLSGGK